MVVRNWIAICLSLSIGLQAFGKQSCVDAVNAPEQAARVELAEKSGKKSVSLLRRSMFNFLNFVLSRRYQVEAKGLDKIYAKGNTNIVFLFEHPALVDPAILYSQVGRQFDPRPVIASSQNKGLLQKVFERLNAVFVPEVGPDNPNAAEEIQNITTEVLASLSKGDNWVIAPSGSLKRTRRDQIRGKKMASDIIHNLPENARVVVVTSKGLWGSTFSYGSTGNSPHMPGLNGDVISGAMFNKLPKHQVQLEFEELSSAELAEMKVMSREEVNDMLDERINRVEQDNVFVPLRKCDPICKLPEPIPEHQLSQDEKKAIASASEAVPQETKDSVIKALEEVFPDDIKKVQSLFHGSAEVTEEELAGNLADIFLFDSLSAQDYQLDFEKLLGIELEEFGGLTPDELLIAVHRAKEGRGDSSKEKPKQRVDLRWFRYAQNGLRRAIPSGKNTLEVLYKKAQENPDAPWMSDEKSGVITYREGISKILLLSRMISKMPGKNIGLMFPPSVGGTLMVFAAMQAGKVPTIINYTAGNANIKYSMDLTGVKSIVTSNEFVKALSEKNLAVDSVQERFVFSEDLIAKAGDRSLPNAVNIAMNLAIREKSRFRTMWPKARWKRGNQLAVILFTSGSSSNPKAVGLTHKNLLTNVRDVAPVFDLTSDDAVLGMAPTFHSLGLTGTVILPALSGIRVTYTPNATDGRAIAAAIDAHKTSFIIGPPNILRAIFAASTKGQLDSLKYVVVGGEVLQAEVAAFLAAKAPHATVLEGAGTTEASPVWALNATDDVRLGWVGKILPSLTYEIVDNESLTTAIASKDMSAIKSIAPGTDGIRQGELVLSGDSVITQYFKNLKPEAFFKWNGRTYFRTEDLVMVDAERRAKILGRFSRQHKALGGEMINHQIIENLLTEFAPLKPLEDAKPTIWVGVGQTRQGEPVTTLVTSRDVTTEQVNGYLGSHLSATWLIRKIIHVSEIPLLGTGKVDGKTCNQLIKTEFDKP